MDFCFVRFLELLVSRLQEVTRFLSLSLKAVLLEALKRKFLNECFNKKGLWYLLTYCS